MDTEGTPSMSALLASLLTWTLKVFGLEAPKLAPGFFRQDPVIPLIVSGHSKAKRHSHAHQLVAVARQTAEISQVGDQPSLSLWVRNLCEYSEKCHLHGEKYL